MPKLTPQEMDRRRGRIVAAARACFARDGFSDCSMDEVCAEAGLSKGAVYNHFPSKEQLIHAVAEEQGRRLRRLGDGGDLQQIGDDLLGLFRHPADGPEARLEFHALSRAFNDVGLFVRMRRNAALLKAALDQALALLEAAGQIHLRADRDRVSEILLTFVQGVSTRRLLAGDRHVREDFDLLLDMLIEKTAV